jgi:cytochrome d ubiquinol oxidase subunit II
MILQILWYVVLGFCALFYVILDGFDLGVGALHLLAKGDRNRRIMINSIGPVWDGNEVWIVVVIGGLMGGFPNAYATVLSGFYTPIMLLLAGLMFRASAIEFRSKHDAPRWRSFWDVVFCVASLIVGFVLGLILGNLIIGIPLNAQQDFVGSSISFFNPYSILIGFTSISLFAMHGSIYLAMKTEGDMHAQIRRWIPYTIGVFFFLYSAVTLATFIYVPHMTRFLENNYYLFILPLLSFLAIINIPRQIHKGQDGWAFISSCASIAGLLALFSFGTFPYLLPSTIDPETNSLTIYNSSSSQGTLKILMTIAIIGVPMVLAYGVWVYHTFRGKVKLDKSSY